MLIARLLLLKMHLEQACATIIALVQPDNRHQPPALGDHKFGTPRNEEQWERLEAALIKYRGGLSKSDAEVN